MPLNSLTIGRHQEVLHEFFPDMFFDSLVTDPPYGLKFMGHHWDYQVPTAEDWVGPLRVLKPGAYGLVFCGTRTQHRMVVNLEDAGFEIRDVISWVYGSGLPKNINISPGVGTVLKPATELITLVRKPFEGTTREIYRTHGTGVLHVDACRVPPTGESLDGGDVKYRDKKKSASEGWDRPWMKDPEALRARAKRGTAAQEKGEKLGRYPANFIHDGSAEVIDMFPHGAGAAAPVKEGAYSGKSKGKYGDFKYKGNGEDVFYNDIGSAARFFYCAKPAPSERNAGTTNGNNHVTVKPMALMRYLVKLITPVGGTCLDPYAGSGTTGCACAMEGMNCILIDQDEKNEVTIRERLAYWEAEAAKGVQAKLW